MDGSKPDDRAGWVALSKDNEAKPPPPPAASFDFEKNALRAEPLTTGHQRADRRFPKKSEDSSKPQHIPFIRQLRHDLPTADCGLVCNLCKELSGERCTFSVTKCVTRDQIWPGPYNTNAFKGQAPTTLADFFDLKKYPGKRGLRKAPQANLEWALMADGVPREKVYATLETEEGVARALAKLDTIKSQVIWWEAGAQPPQLLADGQVSMTSAWNGRIWAAQAKEKQPFKIIWDGQMYDIDVWAVPVGAPNKAKAMDFVRFATSSPVMADQSQYIAYGPTRTSAQSLVHADMKTHMPTDPQNFASALQVNSEWWGDHADELNERFNAWLAK
ncbi:extracellular solute-binding protein [Pseudomonas sp. NPDC090201]|uniref:extracellular solute-binding protein n=1 Tax=Pseudomonas sp. NPDC090201 TaxID=3364475 RepID=UPI0038130047